MYHIKLKFVKNNPEVAQEMINDLYSELEKIEGENEYLKWKVKIMKEILCPA